MGLEQADADNDSNAQRDDAQECDETRFRVTEPMSLAEMFRDNNEICLRDQLCQKVRHIRASEAVCSTRRSIRTKLPTSWVTLIASGLQHSTSFHICLKELGSV